MEKKLPNVYANSIDKEFDNVQGIFYSFKDNIRSSKVEDDFLSLEAKINKIFNSTDYVYKSNVEIETDSGVLEKVIVGKSGNALLTMDNELVDISTIRDIRKI